jgi:hypothetical protein
MKKNKTKAQTRLLNLFIAGTSTSTNIVYNIMSPALYRYSTQAVIKHRATGTPVQQEIAYLAISFSQVRSPWPLGYTTKNFKKKPLALASGHRRRRYPLLYNICYLYRAVYYTSCIAQYLCTQTQTPPACCACCTATAAVKSALSVKSALPCKSRAQNK